MRQNNVINWNYRKELDALLFFAQRMDEILFHHSTDTYRFPTLSLYGVAREYMSVSMDVTKGIIIGEGHLSAIIDEFANLLQNDEIAKEVLGNTFSTRFLKCYKQWNKKDQYDNLVFAQRQLGNRAYLTLLIKKLNEWIKANKEKKQIHKYSAIMVRELIDNGYDENYIYHCVQNVFFSEKVTGLESFDVFINCFDFQEKLYDVFVGYTSDVSHMFSSFTASKENEMGVELLDIAHAPNGIRTRKAKTLLHFSHVKALDAYSAYSMVNSISSIIVNTHLFYRHFGRALRPYGQVMDANNRVTTIRNTDLLKYRVSPTSRDKSTENANRVFEIMLSSYVNITNLPRLIEKHNVAIYSESASDSLLGLWSILESQIEIESENNTDKFSSVCDYVLPFLMSTYIYKLTSTCMNDIKHWDEDFFEERILKNGFGSTEIEHTFAFLSFATEQESRDLLFSQTETYPLLRYRVASLSDTIKNTKGIKRILNEHSDRVSWHLRRIYRARNYIIHDGLQPQNCEELVVNLHSYVDTLINKAIELINESPYPDTIKDILITHKLSVVIMKELLNGSENVDITPSNATVYLYFKPIE